MEYQHQYVVNGGHPADGECPDIPCLPGQQLSEGAELGQELRSVAFAQLQGHAAL